ncbi:hypothetical protein [Glycomyces salinus]|nr:hypothetical protein [Glycomyces salinus]
MSVPNWTVLPPISAAPRTVKAWSTGTEIERTGRGIDCSAAA